MAQKYCTQCGEILEPGSKFCTGCGRMVEQQTQSDPAAYQQTGNWNGTPTANEPYGMNSYGYPPVTNRPPVTGSVTKREYRKLCTNGQYLKELKSSAIALYVLIGLNTVLALLTEPLGLIDVVIYLALTLGMHMGKSKGCAIAVLCYSVFNIVLTLIVSAKITGWLWIIAAIGAIRAFCVADREYESVYGIQ